MKKKKAVRKLEKVEAILSDVIERYTTIDQNTGHLLTAAMSSVSRAKEALGVEALPEKGKKPSAKTEKPSVSPEAEKTNVPAVKKQKRGGDKHSR